MSEGDNCHTISINSTEYRIIPANFSLGSPSVIRQLCANHAVHIGDMQVSAVPYPLHIRGVSEFLDLLTNPRRLLPILFISPFANDDRNLMTASELARRLAGIAIVVQASDAETTWEVTDVLGRTLSCFDGATRIYWPNFSTTDDPRLHPLYVGARIADVGADVIARSIERLLFAVAAFRFVPDARISDVIKEHEKFERHQRLESQKKENGIGWEEYALDLDQNNQILKEEVSLLRAENANLKANQQIIWSTRGSAESDEAVSAETTKTPTSVKNAVEEARAKFSNLDVLDSAVDSAIKSPFRRPNDILDCLRQLDEVCAERTARMEAGGVGGDLILELKRRGFRRCSMHISDTTRTMDGRHYTFTYNGRRELFEPHITLGGTNDPNTCASIHFKVDDNRKKIIVAHVGRHLPNTQT